MSIMPYVALFLSAMCGGLIGAMLDRNSSTKYLTFILPLSGAFLLGVAVLHMLPEVFFESKWEHKIGIYILGGFFLQNLLEFLSRGVEHGHIHARESHNGLYIFSIMFGLCTHALIEGLPVAHMSGEHSGHVHDLISRPYLWGIVAHKLPAAIALSILLLASKVKKVYMFLFILVFALMSPLGTLISHYANFSSEIQRIVLSISIGFGLAFLSLV